MKTIRENFDNFCKENPLPPTKKRTFSGTTFGLINYSDFKILKEEMFKLEN